MVIARFGSHPLAANANFGRLAAGLPLAREALDALSAGEPARGPPRRHLLGIYRPPFLDRLEHADLVDRRGVHGERVPVEDHQVARLAGLDRALVFVFRSAGERPQRGDERLEWREGAHRGPSPCRCAVVRFTVAHITSIPGSLNATGASVWLVTTATVQRRLDRRDLPRFGADNLFVPVAPIERVHRERQAITCSSPRCVELVAAAPETGRGSARCAGRLGRTSRAPASSPRSSGRWLRPRWRAP